MSRNPADSVPRGGDGTTRVVRYKARMRRGAACVGSERVHDLPAFVKDKFDAGWRWLTVTDGDIEVGGITRHPDTNKRTWWAEGGSNGQV